MGVNPSLEAAGLQSVLLAVVQVLRNAPLATTNLGHRLESARAFSQKTSI